MREPECFVRGRIDETIVPLSLASSRALACIVNGSAEPAHANVDADFVRRYAAILLKERGL